MQTKMYFLVSLKNWATIMLLLFLANTLIIAQNTSSKTKLGIAIDKNGEQIKIDTLIDTSQLPLLFEELNRQMPVIENFMEELSGENFDLNFGKDFENFFNDNFIQSFEGMLKGFENLDSETLNLDNALQQMFKNFEGFKNLGGDGFNFDSVLPSSKTQLGLVLSEKSENGVTQITVNEVEKGSLAAKAGLLKGDKITQIDGQKNLHIHEISKAVQSKKNQETLKIGIERQGVPTTLDIKITVPEPEKINEKTQKI